MNRNVMIVLAGGFLIAVLVALLVKASLSGGPEEPVVLQEEPKVQIVVASKDLKIGTELSDDNMKWQDWPENAVFPGAVTKEEDKKPSESLSGRLRRDIKSGEPIVKSALVEETKGNFIAASLTQGMRAVAIDVEASSMVGGFIKPGDFVDVILTYKENIPDTKGDKPEVDALISLSIDKLATETILQNAKVLAVDQRSAADGDDDDGKVKVGKTVTLEVDYTGAEVLALASEMGELRLALRGIGDDIVKLERPPVITDERMTRIYDEVVGEVSKMTGQTTRFVRIYRGDEVEDLSVTPD